MSFLHFFAVFYKKYSDLLQVFFQCKKYSESTAGNVTQRKTVIFTADIFAVQVTQQAQCLAIILVCLRLKSKDLGQTSSEIPDRRFLGNNL